MEIVLMRHGETEWNLSRRIQGTKPVPLNANGIRQVHHACHLLVNKYQFHFSQIVTSPLIRAVQSAKICSRLLNTPLSVLDNFRERSFGKLEGKTHREIESQFHLFDVEEVSGSVYGIEPISMLDERLSTSFHILKSTYDGKKVLIVTHGSIIRRIGQIYGQHYGLISNGAFIQLNI